MTKTKDPVRVYPVPGRYRLDVPHVEHDCTDPACVESGAFTDKPPKATPADEPKE
jgi:hypothetical protein